MNTQATHDAWLMLTGYMQSREGRDQRRRYLRWRREHAEKRVWIAMVCRHGTLSAADAMKLLNDTMYYDQEARR